MSDTYPTLRTVASLALVGLLLASAIGPAVGQSTTRTADLAIEQPAYASGGVSSTTDNGSRVYQVTGDEHDLVPTNFDAADVVDFGVEGQTGAVTFDPTFNEYDLQTPKRGTYRVFWVVNEQVATENNSTSTATVRYEAAVRVTGGTNLTHQPAGATDRLREQAANWEEFNSTLHSEAVYGPGANTEQATQEMIRLARLKNHPWEALTGNFTGMVILAVTTIGGLLFVALLMGGALAALRTLQKRLSIFEAIESEEGTAKDTLAALDFEERKSVLQNLDWTDIFADDHVAAAFREQFGETPFDGTVEWLSLLRPRNLVADRVQAMGQDGYVATVPGGGEDLATDGGTLDVADVETVELRRTEEVPDGHATADPSTLGQHDLQALVDALDWDSTTIRTFDLAAADFDPADLETPYESMDLSTLIERSEAETRHFDDPETFGTYALEFVETVRDHPQFTDDDGRVEDLRYAMSHWLELAQLLDDRFAFPVVHFHRDALERALVDYDPEREAQTYVDDVVAGRAD